MKPLLLLLAALAASAQVRRGNVFELVLEDGLAELEWIGTASFRLSRVESFDRSRAPVTREIVRVSCGDEPAAVRCRTEHMELELAKAGGGVRVRKLNGQVLLDGSGAGAALQAGERIYGLGARTGPSLDLRGARVRSEGGLLISSAGFGEYRPGACSYDFTGPRWTTSCGREFFFYYGPAPKEILDSHSAVRPGEGRSAWIVRAAAAQRSWKQLRENLYAIQHAAMSAGPLPHFEASGYEGETAQRALQTAALMPVVHAASPRMPALREKLLPYLETYAWEARDRGIPAVRPLAMQFPEDAVAAARTDEFMSGDEILVAPMLEPGTKRQVYLPRGIWTEIRSGAVYKGRQEVTVEAPPDWTPLFVRNGMIVPLAGRPLEMHYFPRLGAEFFLWEPDLEYISQFHASPAADLLRLESESIKAREFEWVVHNLEPVKRVYEEGHDYTREASAESLTPRTWHYDPVRKTLRVRLQAADHGDEIVHVEFEQAPAVE